MSNYKRNKIFIHESNKSLKLLITSNKKYYKVNEPIYLDVKLINKGEKSLFVFQFMIPNVTIDFIIKDKNDNILPYQGIRDTRAIFIGLGDYIFLSKNKYYGYIFELNGKRLKYKFKRGKYKIKVIFEDYSKYSLFERLKKEGKELLNSEKEDFWSGVLESNEITIYIR
ncbi:MAG: hypothetical protein ACTSRP_23975 [Candidatus Helarchaeota archaeon]